MSHESKSFKEIGRAILKEYLSVEDWENIKSMHKIKQYPFILEYFKSMLLILAAYAITYKLINKGISLAIVSSILLVFIVATRQVKMAYLLHEQTHFLFLKGKLGDFLCNIFISFPLFVSVEEYRKIHFKHHDHSFSSLDPDYVRKSGDLWGNFKSYRSIFWILLKSSLGLYTLDLLKSKRNPSEKIPGLLTKKIIYYSVLLAFAFYFPIFGYFLLVWVATAFTVAQGFFRWGALIEHVYNLDKPSLLEATIMIKLNKIEELVIPSLNFNTYHFLHHLLPGLPFYNLSKAYDILDGKGVFRNLKIVNGHLGYLNEVLISK